jgi:hypothetical protein
MRKTGFAPCPIHRGPIAMSGTTGQPGSRVASQLKFNMQLAARPNARHAGLHFFALS